MGLLRSVLLAGSESRWLRERAVRFRFVRRAVARFMPGEDAEAALAAAWIWIDMESSAYTDATLDIYRRARKRLPNVGVCVQAYLHRTERDLQSLIPLGAGVRLVKGAYREPPDRAFPGKRD